VSGKDGETDTFALFLLDTRFDESERFSRAQIDDRTAAVPAVKRGIRLNKGDPVADPYGADDAARYAPGKPFRCSDGENLRSDVGSIPRPQLQSCVGCRIDLQQR